MSFAGTARRTSAIDVSSPYTSVRPAPDGIAVDVVGVSISPDALQDQGDEVPNRIIKESICASETLAALPAEAERLFYRLITQADDFGRFDGRPFAVRTRCFQAMVDQISESDVAGWLELLKDIGLIQIYQVNDRQYGFFVTWNLHQREFPRTVKSKWPCPLTGLQHPDNICKHMPSDVVSHQQMQSSDRNGQHMTAQSGAGAGSYPNPYPNPKSGSESESSSSSSDETRAKTRDEDEDDTTADPLTVFLGLWRDNYGVPKPAFQIQVERLINEHAITTAVVADAISKTVNHEPASPPAYFEAVLKELALKPEDGGVGLVIDGVLEQDVALEITDPGPKNLWPDILDYVRGKIPRPSFETWFSTTTGLGFTTPENYVVGVPGIGAAEHLLGNYYGLITDAVQRACPDVKEISVIVLDPEPS